MQRYVLRGRSIGFHIELVCEATYLALIAEHALSRGFWGHAPQKNLALNLVVILTEIMSNC